MDLNFITNHVLFEVREGVAYITLNDPEHLNPVTAEVTQDLVQCLIYCERENEVRAIVFRGAGWKFYRRRQCQRNERPLGSGN